MNYRFIVLEDKKPESFQIDLIQEYEKRLSRYCKTKLLLVKKEKDVLKQYKETNYSVAVIPGQSQVTSVDFAHKINDWAVRGQANIDFYLFPGQQEALGIAIQEQLAVSNMEIQPIITAGLLYEQVYRAYRILNKEPYHK